MLISFIIPCYNSEATISVVTEEIKKLFFDRQGYEYEIILVDDASTDNTLKIIKMLCNQDSRIIGISLARNQGQQSAIMAGLSHSKGDLVVCSDDDGQTPVNTVFDLIDKLSQGYDIVCGKYVNRGKRSLFRRMGTFANEYMSQKLLGKPKGLYTSVYFVAKRFVVDEIIKYDKPYPYMSGLFLRVTKNIGNIEVEQGKRIAGESGYTFKKLVSLWVNGFTTFSIKPLRAATMLGMIIAVVGFLLAIALIIKKIMVPHIAIGWTSIIAVNLLVGGNIMLMLGLIGEYVGRIYISINKSPQYVVRDIYHKEKENCEI